MKGASTRRQRRRARLPRTSHTSRCSSLHRLSRSLHSLIPSPHLLLPYPLPLEQQHPVGLAKDAAELPIHLWFDGMHAWGLMARMGVDDMHGG